MECDETQCLDLSMKIWLILYLEGSDPGFEFEIFNKNCLLGECSEILERGAHVKVGRENSITQAIVVAVSDDLKYLEKIFSTVTGDFLNGQQNEIRTCVRFRDMATQTDDVQLPFISSFEEILKNTILNQENTETLFIEKDLFKAKYLELYRKFKAIKGSIKSILTKPETAESGSADSAVSKPNVLKSLNTININGCQTETISKNVDPEMNEDENKYVSIGKNNTLVLKDIFYSINWTSYTTATRRLLVAVFPRHVLATHSLTGKPSPAFIGANKKVKSRLDPMKISDIVETVCARSNVSASMVRNAITTKCADENKMQRKRQKDVENGASTSKKFKNKN